MKKKRLWIVLALIIVLAAAGGAYWWTQLRGAETVVADTGDTLQTTTARRGSLEIMTTAAGTVSASLERTLGFDTPSELLELYVTVGQLVQEGDLLARVDDLTLRKALATAEANVSKDEVALQTAQDKLAELTGEVDEAALLNATANLASAQSKLATLEVQPTAAELAMAQASLSTAQATYQRLVDGATPEELQEAQWSLEQAKNSLWSAQMSRDAAAQGRSYDQAQVGVLNAELAVARAELNLQKLQAPPTAAELAQARANVLKAQEALATVQAGASEAELATARAAVLTAQRSLDDLQAGATGTEIAAAEVGVRQAELDLEQARLTVETARRDLEAATLTAPINGTVMAITATVGDKAGASLITIADLTRPVLDVYIDQSDMAYLKAGYAASIEFDALPGEIYTGEVVRVDPGLTSSAGMTVVHGLVAVDAAALPAGVTLPIGLSATVDIIAGSAKNAVLVPVEALRKLDVGQYAVFVVTDGQPRLRMVEVGLMDVSFAQIVSGLEAGEVVTTGLAEVK
ncbi:MAG: efflux RND transporter periplasmic adaptor subunit [Anaerolineae bacterium]